VLIFLKTEVRIVSIPIRPTNIKSMITILPGKLKEAVMPRLNPTVLKAEKLSKAISTRFLFFSNNHFNVFYYLSLFIKKT
jgi:hypothetical protein